MNIRNILVILCFFGLTNCAVKKSTNANMSTALFNTQWQIVEIDGKSIASKVNDKEPYILFDNENNRYAAITGCNTLNGEFETNSDQIKLKNGISTMMFCQDMSVEDGLKRILAKISAYQITKDSLILMDSHNKALVKLKVLTTEQKTANHLKGTTWELNLLSQPGLVFNELFKDKKPTLIFDKESDKVFGNAGCNNYNGAAKINQQHVQFGPFMSTKMMCPQIKGESAYLDLLSKVNKFSVSGDELHLIIGDIAVMRFNKVR